MINNVNRPNIPLGLGMALAENLEAMNYFSSLSSEQQQKIIDRTHSITSKAEMRNFAASLVKLDLNGSFRSI